MYEHVDWMKCKGCGNTDCLFKLRVDFYTKRKTGNIVYKTMPWCKICFLENNRIKGIRYFDKNQKRILKGQRAWREKNREYYNYKHRQYRKNKKVKISEYNAKRYKKVSVDGRKKQRIRPSVGKNNPYRNFTFGSIK